MTSFLKSVAIWVLAAVLAAPPAFAQERGADYGQEELDRLLAPIALYPDSLLSQVLMASTYPLEVVEAARWSRANPRLKGEEAVNAVEAMDWDPSVKSLVAFPQILHRMDERLDWTQRLGEAFLAQEPQVLDTIQSLRQRAAAAGNLRSDDRMRVASEGDLIMIEPADPRVVYVPYYDPAIVYGPWWWTAPPIAWGPPVGYVVASGWPGFFWAPAIVVSTGFFFGRCDFHHHHVKVVQRHVVTHSRFGKPVRTVVTTHAKPVAWKHNPSHRKGVPYRHATLRKEFGRFGGGDARRDSHRAGTTVPATQGSGQRFRSAPQLRQDRSSSLPSAGERGSAAQPTPSAPGARQRRPDPSANNVLRFPGRMDQPAAPAPATRREQPVSNGHNVARLQGRMAQPASALAVRRQPPASNGNDVLRFQRRGPVSRPAPAAPVVRQAQRPPAAVPHGTRQPAAVPRQPLRFQASRPVMAPRASAPAPQARAASGARAGNGNHPPAARGWRGGSLR